MLGGLREYTLDWQKFEKSWKQTRDQIGEILQDMGGDSFGNMELTDLEVGLSISGKGTVGIASVSGAATITLKFKVK